MGTCDHDHAHGFSTCLTVQQFIQ